MPRYKRRQRLTERVAARQAGHKAEPEPRSRRWSRIGAQVGYAVSLVGLGLLAYEALIIAQGEPISIPTLVIYAGLFMGGRLIKLVLDTARPFL